MSTTSTPTVAVEDVGNAAVEDSMDSAGSEPHVSSEDATFASLGLDDRLRKACTKLGWSKPTLIQSHVIREALSGKDVLARARTGSGKTGAYALPMLHQLLQQKQENGSQRVTTCLVLVPTKELAKQACKNIREIAKFCTRNITVIDVAGDKPLKAMKASLLEKPDILIGTPSRVLSHVQAGHIDLSESIKTIVIDEADLVLSFGHEEDVVKLLTLVPPIRQNLLMSATLGSEVDALKKLVLRRPVVLKLEESDLPAQDQLVQQTISCFEDDKFLISYALLKLRLIRGKTIFFVNDVDRCYRLKLFLEQFSIKSCVLNSELPIQSRQHIVNQFNKGIYDYVLASDEAIKVGRGASSKRKKGSKKDSEYGVARGIDFKGVNNVINFDFPRTPEAYVHRVGRTARGEDAGVALSLLSTAADRETLAKTQDLLRADVTGDDPLKPYAFKIDAIDGLRYRVRDALKGVTKHAVREARRKEIRQEILNSEILKQHFEENPRDAEVLRHDAGLSSSRKIKPHLKHLPEYLVPSGTEAARVKKRKDISKFVHTKASKAKKRRQNDPLRSFGKKKSSKK
eukprot:m.656457 g.656457  ORF g.656457 m.656457 type:complete len:571 (-) comp22703_c0_seq2:2776-4488(-)